MSALWRSNRLVTLTQQEQARLQVLNNLLAGYMTTEQAATLMGVSTRHTRRILLQPTDVRIDARTNLLSGIRRGRSSRTSSTAIEVADLPTLHLAHWRAKQYVWRAADTPESTTGLVSPGNAPERVAEGAGGHRHRS